MLRNERFLSRRRSIEISLRNSSVLESLRRVERVGISVNGDKALVGDPEHLSPDFTDGMDTPVLRLVEGLVGRGVDGLILLAQHHQYHTKKATRRTYQGVGVVPNAIGAVGSPGTHGVVGVNRGATNGGSQEI
jgi:hypothetical protein